MTITKKKGFICIHNNNPNWGFFFVWSPSFQNISIDGFGHRLDVSKKKSYVNVELLGELIGNHYTKSKWRWKRGNL